MAVDLGDLVDAVRLSANPPGAQFIAGTDDEWTQYLANAFWDGYRFGFFRGYKVDPTTFTIEMTTATADLAPEDQRIVVLFAAYVAIRNKILQIGTSTRYQAGPVEVETERAATVLTAILSAVRGDLEMMMQAAGYGARAPQAITVFDNYLARDARMLESAAVWVR